MYSGDNSTQKEILKEAAEEHGKTSLIIEFKNNAEMTATLSKEADVSLEKLKSDFIQNITTPDDNTYCVRARSSTNKLNSLDAQLGKVGTMVSLAKTNYGMCANNAYRTTNCENELSNLRTYENRYSTLVAEYNQKLKTHNYNVEKCESHMSYYDTKVKEVKRKQEATGNHYRVKIQSLNERQAVIIDELIKIMDKRPYLSETRYPNGNLESTGIRFFGKGNANGIWKYYHENGEIKRIGEFVDGKANGIWKLYYKNEVLKSQEKYTLGKRNGLCKYYHANGKLETMGMFKEEERVGLWKVYDEDGAFKEEVKF